MTGVAGISYAVENLFQRNFGANGACDDICDQRVRSRRSAVNADVGFSPPTPGQKANTLCWEANVLTFNSSQRARFEEHPQRLDDVLERLG